MDFREVGFNSNFNPEEPVLFTKNYFTTTEFINIS